MTINPVATMKSTHFSLFLLCATAAFASITKAQTWDIVFQDIFNPKDMATHPDGTLYVAGYFHQDGLENPAVIRAAQDGTQWEMAFAGEAAAANTLDVRAMTIVPSGTVYVCGHQNGLMGVWVGDGNGALSFVASFPTGFDVSDIASDAASRLYVCGINYSGRVNRWQTLIGIPNANGISWMVMDSYSESQANSSFARRIAVRPSNDPLAPAEIWVAGKPGNKNAGVEALRKSIDGGTTWSTLGSFDWGSGGWGIGGLAVKLDGEVYVVGRLTRKLTKTSVEYRWLARRSLDGGAGWGHVDELGGGYEADCVAVDPLGRVLVAGRKVSAGGGLLVRQSEDHGSTWQTTLSFGFGTGGWPLSIGSDTAGNAYLGALNFESEPGTGLIFRQSP